LEEKEWALIEGLCIILSVFLDTTEGMSAEKYPTFVYALPVLRQVKMHLSIEDMFTTECPDENVNFRIFCLEMLDDFKKRFADMTIDLLWTTALDPWCHSLKHLNQYETDVARNKLIKEVMYPAKKPR
jgi:acyl carrier protein phosphodiesterase